MTPEEQRIAIAEKCGWKKDPTWSYDVWIEPGKNYPVKWSDLPDYCNDLNAMHEAEKTLAYEQLPYYCDRLLRALMKTEGVSEFDKIHATAAQRAEAFLRTVGKWKGKDGQQ